MSNEPIETTFVSPDTDDLDAFNSLIEGKSSPAPHEPEEAKEDVSVSEDAPLETDEPEESDEDSPAEEEKAEKPAKKINKVQERINELTAQARSAERREAELQKKLDEFAEKQKEFAQATAVKKAEESSPHPDAKNEDGSEKYPLGEFDPAYIRDLTRHTIQAEQAVAKEQEAKERATRQEQEARDSLQSQWVEKLTPVLDKYEDFLDKTMELESTFDGLDPQYSDYLVQTVKSLEFGPEVLYYFANNINEANKFVKLGPLAATLALGEYNAMFKGQTRKEPAKVSAAPPPPQVNKGSKTRTTVAADTDDLDAFSELLFKRR